MTDILKQKSLTRETLKIYWRHARKYPWQFFSLSTIPFIVAAISLTKPLFYKEFFDLLASGNTDIFPELVKILVWISLAMFSAWALQTIVEFTHIRFIPKVRADLVNSSFAFLMRNSYEFFVNNFAGGLVRRDTRFSVGFHQLFKRAIRELGQTI